jgi:hypothetical protein
MSRRPRDQRDLERARRAAATAQAQGKPPIEVAVAQINAAFNEASVVNAFKLRIERLLRLGPQHPAVRVRFGTRAEILRGRNLDAAIVLAERWWRAERTAFQIASAFGRGRRLSLDVLTELRLILRLLRWKRMHAEFPAIIAALCDDEEMMRIAAE